MSMCWDPFDQIRWMIKNLKPSLLKYGFDDIKILTIDDQRLSIPYYLLALETDPNSHAIKDVDMIGVHWYLDEIFSTEIFDRIDLKYKMPIIYTESVTGTEDDTGTGDTRKGPVLGSWSRTVTYISKIIQIFNHYVSGFGKYT